MKHRESFASVMHSRAAKFTADCMAGKYKIPPVAPGHQKQIFKPGDRVEYREGTGREGVTYTVLDSVLMNGYESVGLDCGFARQQDLKRAT